MLAPTNPAHPFPVLFPANVAKGCAAQICRRTCPARQIPINRVTLGARRVKSQASSLTRRAFGTADRHSRFHQVPAYDHRDGSSFSERLAALRRLRISCVRGHMTVPRPPMTGMGGARRPACRLTSEHFPHSRIRNRLPVTPTILTTSAATCRCRCTVTEPRETVCKLCARPDCGRVRWLARRRSPCRCARSWHPVGRAAEPSSPSRSTTHTPACRWGLLPGSVTS